MNTRENLIFFGDGWHYIESDPKTGTCFIWNSHKSSILINASEITSLEFNIKASPACSKEIKFTFLDASQNAIASEKYSISEGSNVIKITLPEGTKRCVLENDAFTPSLVMPGTADFRELGLIFTKSIKAGMGSDKIEFPIDKIRKFGKATEKFSLKKGMVSVIFPVYGDFDVDRVLIAIASAKNQKNVDVETVVSEQGEFPRLKDKLDKSVVYIFRKYVPPEDLSDFNPGEVRNDGVDASSGEFIYTNDSDIVFMNEYFLAKCKEILDYRDDLVLYHPPMRRLPIENFEEFKKRVEWTGISKAIASLNLANEFLATTDDKERYLKVSVTRVLDEWAFRIITASTDKFLSYVSDHSLKGKEPIIWSGNVHYGGNFFRRGDFEDVGGYCEQYINWGCEDADIQWKFRNAYNLQLFPKIGEFTVLHLDHEKNYLTQKIRERNLKTYERRKLGGAYLVINEDKRRREERHSSLSD